jgi:hypothetical protein
MDGENEMIKERNPFPPGKIDDNHGFVTIETWPIHMVSAKPWMGESPLLANTSLGAARIELYISHEVLCELQNMPEWERVAAHLEKKGIEASCLLLHPE